MSTAALNTTVSHVAIEAIRLYQRWVSPRKGFCCAHNTLHGQGSCSGFGVKVLQVNGFATALTLMRLRIRQCYLANLVLEEDRRKKRQRQIKKAAGIGAVNVAEVGLDVAATGMEAADCCGGILGALA